MFCLVTWLCHQTLLYIWSVILGAVLRASEWSSRLAAAPGDAAVPIVGVRSLGQAWVQGWISTQRDHSTFHLPKSPHAAFAATAEVRGGREGGKALWAGPCTAWARARSQLCGLLCSTVVTSSSGTSLLSVCKFLHGLVLPCSTSGTAPQPGRVRGRVPLCMQFFCKEPRCSTNDFYFMCISVSEDHILVLS